MGECLATADRVAQRNALEVAMPLLKRLAVVLFSLMVLLLPALPTATPALAGEERKNPPRRRALTESRRALVHGARLLFRHGSRQPIASAAAGFALPSAQLMGAAVALVARGYCGGCSLRGAFSS